ncbi:Uu.00g137160.m01.CDS01 [Anthostomella pinea]|uniref:Uu.00g137160.m01.CDS01 n=1 Tax=Anthostomella pinea TaxID=933095 RepID=A0AAI8YL75_9PEZI|nr:Uu.00g137160.m01.CDS01 [Anthostomella pinea]
MTTSAECVLALATQSAYTASNNFQEMFARYRRGLGLPASTASFGLITDVGSLSTNSTTLSLMARNKVLNVTTHQFLQLLELALLNNLVGPSGGTTQGWTGAQDDPFSGANVITCFDPRAMAAREREGLASGSGHAGSLAPRWYSDMRVGQVMRALEDAEWYFKDVDTAAANCKHSKDDSNGRAGTEDDRAKMEDMVSTTIAGTVAQMLFIDVLGVDAARTVADYGVDSLIAAELRNWLNMAFGVDISMLELLDTKTCMRDLARGIVNRALATGHQA